MEHQVNLAAFVCHSDGLQVDQEASALYLVAFAIDLHKWVLIKLDAGFLQASVYLAAQEIHGKAWFICFGTHEAYLWSKALARLQLRVFEIHS